MTLTDRLAPYCVTRLPRFAPIVSWRLGLAAINRLRVPAVSPLFGDEVRFAGVTRGGRMRLERVPA